MKIVRPRPGGSGTGARALAASVALLGLTEGCGGPASPPLSGAPSPALSEARGRTPATAASGAAAGPWFEDVTAASGIDFRHRHGGSGRRYMVETMGSGVALVDVDADEDLDVLLLQGAPLPGTPTDGDWSDRLYRNDGAARFSDATAERLEIEPGYSMGACAGDVDEDGDADVVVARFGPDRLLLSEGGRLVDRTAASGFGADLWATSCAMADFDRDGCLDVAVVHYVDFTIATHKRCEDGGIVSYCHPDAYAGVPDRLFRGRCDGTFEDVSDRAGIAVSDPDESKGLGALWTDFDDDGWQDLYVTNDSTRNFLWRNRGDGTFEELGVRSGTAFNAAGRTEAGMGIAAGDVDADGRLDLFVTNLDLETNTLYLQSTHGFFEDATRWAGLARPSHERVGFGAELLDADLDGDLDLYVTNGHVNDNAALLRATASHAQPDQLLANESGRFAVVEDAGPWFHRERVGRAVAAGDLDGDGDRDLVVTACDDRPTVLLNRIGDGRPSLTVELRLSSGRWAVGARATLEDDSGRRQVREVRAGSGYLASGGRRQIFALPDGARPRSLEIRWPDGSEETVTGDRLEPRDGIVRLERGIGELPAAGGPAGPDPDRTGRERVDLGEPDAATAELEASARELDTADLWAELGALERRRRRVDAAVMAFRRALGRDRHHLAGLLGLGQALVASGRSELGDALLERHRAAAEARDFLDSYVRATAAPDAPLDAFLHRARLHRELDEAAAAEEALRGAVRRFPEHPAALLSLATLLVETGRPAEAAAVLERLPEALGADPAVLFLRGALRLAEGDVEEASALFARSRQRGGWPAPVWVDAGRAWERTGLPGRAAEAFAAAAAARPDDGAAHLGSARALARLGKLEAALGAVDRALELDPGDGEARLLRAAVALRSGDRAAARSTFRRALAARPVDLLAFGGPERLRAELQSVGVGVSDLELLDEVVAEALADAGVAPG